MALPFPGALGVDRLGHIDDAPAFGIGAGDLPSSQLHIEMELSNAKWTRKIDEGGLRLVCDRIRRKESCRLGLDVFRPSSAAQGGR
jgi:hypothetical protein